MAWQLANSLLYIQGCINRNMEFADIKNLFESELIRELGAEHPFRVVGTGEWTGQCAEQEGEMHLEDQPRACFECKTIHVPEGDYNDFTVARIEASVEMILEHLEAA